MSAIASKIISGILAVLLLSGCAGFGDPSIKTEEVARTKLDLTLPPPLLLSDIHFQVAIIEGKPAFILSEDDFKKLAVNMELTQEQLHNYYNIITSQELYYERKDLTPPR